MYKYDRHVTTGDRVYSCCTGICETRVTFLDGRPSEEHTDVLVWPVHINSTVMVKRHRSNEHDVYEVICRETNEVLHKVSKEKSYGARLTDVIALWKGWLLRSGTSSLIQCDTWEEHETPRVDEWYHDGDKCYALGDSWYELDPNIGQLNQLGERPVNKERVVCHDHLRSRRVVYGTNIAFHETCRMIHHIRFDFPAPADTRALPPCLLNLVNNYLGTLSLHTQRKVNQRYNLELREKAEEQHQKVNTWFQNNRIVDNC